MAKGQPKSKNRERLMEAVILVFVIVTVGLLVFQIATNVMDTLEQEQTTQQATNTPPAATATARPVVPTPTFDVNLTPEDA